MLFFALLEKLALIGNPAAWPRFFRRCFVILCPITVPVFIAVWMGIILTVIAAALISIIVCILIEAVDVLIQLWRK